MEPGTDAFLGGTVAAEARSRGHHGRQGLRVNASVSREGLSRHGGRAMKPVRNAECGVRSECRELAGQLFRHFKLNRRSIISIERGSTEINASASQRLKLSQRLMNL